MKYKLLQDLPDLGHGAIFDNIKNPALYTHHTSPGSIDNCCFTYLSDIVEDRPYWFEPVDEKPYEPITEPKQ